MSPHCMRRATTSRGYATSCPVKAEVIPATIAGIAPTCTRGSRGGHEGVTRGSRGGHEEVTRGSLGRFNTHRLRRRRKGQSLTTAIQESLTALLLIYMSLIYYLRLGDAGHL
eukprot:52878-Prorocentrum_minimum.AAC.1